MIKRMMVHEVCFEAANTSDTVLGREGDRIPQMCVQVEMQRLGIVVGRLPGYSPDRRSCRGCSTFAIFYRNMYGPPYQENPVYSNDILRMVGEKPIFIIEDSSVLRPGPNNHRI